MIPFIVPTYRRHSNGEAQTFEHVPRDQQLTVVCRESERELYERLLRDLGRERDALWPIPEGAVDGIATTRQWIVDESLRRGHTRVVMLDDDLHFIVRGKIPQGIPGWDYKLRPCDAADFAQLVDWFESTLETYQHCAVSMREGNNRVPGLHVQEEATRGIRAVGYRLDLFAAGSVFFRPEVEGREDIDMTLQLLRLRCPNLVTYHWAQGQRSAGAPGGLEGVRTAEHHDASARRLAELHPGLVYLRTKVNKSGSMSGERTEVTVRWKKALASANK